MTPAELFERYEGLAYHIANSWARRLLRSGIRDDIRQQAMLGLWKACLVCKDQNTFAGYVSRRVNGEILDYLRRQDTTRDASRREKQGHVRPLLVAIEEARGVAGACKSPEEVAFASDFARKLEAAIEAARLTARESKVIRLIYREGLSAKDSGARLGISGPRVSDIHAAALRKIRAAVPCWMARAA